MEKRYVEMNTAKIIAVTEPILDVDGNLMVSDTQTRMTPDQFIAYVARVSNPDNQANHLTAPKLLRYLAKHRHWSPFEQVDVNMEIHTTRDIARQVLRHRSFSFQEFSQRYADPTQSLGFSTREARLQDLKNRQNSIEINDQSIEQKWQWIQDEIAQQTNEAYRQAIELGIAKEQARAVLPEGLTNSRMYMKGSVRSWIHYCQVRTDPSTQKEHRQIALDAWYELTRLFPSLKDALDIGEK
jgi:thymidylate synthase (FAD)